MEIGHFWVPTTLRGCLHDTGATFAPPRVQSGSLSWLNICFHDTTTKCHAGASHPGVSSARLLYRSENFTPVRNLATVSSKRETTTRFGVKSVCQWTGTGSACVMFAILNRSCFLSTWSVPSNDRDMEWPIIINAFIIIRVCIHSWQKNSPKSIPQVSVLC